MRNTLEISSLTVKYGQIEILRNVSLHLNETGITGLIGSNGAGKSTLAKTIMGLLRPAAGEIRFEGERIDGFKPKEILRKGISCVSSEPFLFPNMTVMENLILGGQLFPDRISDNLKRVFDLFPILEERKHQQAGTLSGGERQSLMIGRSLMTNPRVLIADEVSAGLAPKLANLVYDSLRELARNGVLILLIEQYVRRALDMADFIYVMENGSIVLEGRPEEVAGNAVVKTSYLGLEG